MWARLTLAAAAATTIVACSGAGSGTAAHPVSSAPAPATLAKPEASNGLAAVASAYTLVAVAGYAVPYSPTPSKANPSPTQVVSGTLDLRPDGTFEMSTQYRAVEPQGERRFDGQFSGACATDGDGYRLYWEGGGETLLTVRGDTLVVNREAVVFRYVRRR